LIDAVVLIEIGMRLPRSGAPDLTGDISVSLALVDGCIG
jgi:hypothetical protein